jgi:hypothetical protein
MSRKLLGILFVITLSASLIIIPAALAQSPLKFSTAEIDLWPEYDRPSVLVIYRLTLAPGTSLPADLTLRIPAASGDPNAVAVKQTDGTLVTVAYDRQVSGEWGLIKFTATAPEVQFEYYDLGLTKDKTARHYQFRWPADYATDMLAVQVQQPFDATDISISPNLGGQTPGQDGLIYYSAQMGAIPAGQVFSVTIDYQKPTDKLSAENLKVQPGGSIATASTSPWSRLMPYLPWILGVLGVVLIAGGGWWYWRSGFSKEHHPEGSGRPRHRPAATREPAASAEGYIYCHECGKRAGPGDRFCRACGAKLRSE